MDVLLPKPQNRKRTAQVIGPAPSASPQVLPDADAAGELALLHAEVADDQVRPAVAVQISHGTSHVIAGVLFERMADKNAGGGLLQKHDRIEIGLLAGGEES